MLHCCMICLWKGRIVSSQNDLSLERKIVSLQYDLFLERKKVFVVVVVTRLLPRDGGMAKHHGSPDARQLLKAWTRDCKETESRQRASGTKSPVAGQCKWR